MRNLRVSQFSTIERADMDFAPVTLIIGPQASGKSVLCKLNYFFLAIIQESARSISEGVSLEDYRESIREKFFRWFPIGTWGPEKFDLVFTCIGFEIKISRSIYAGQVSDKIRISLGDSFEFQYEEAQKTALARQKVADSRDLSFDDAFPRWEIQELVRRRLSHVMGKDWVASQLFVPAGRSFFTSIGRAIAVFENSDSIDPLTLEFGRLFASRLDRESLRLHPSRSIANYVTKATTELLKGDIFRERNKDFLKTKDGRRIPLGAMSSGQQELLPLLRMLPLVIYPERRIYYIEEPEAHLFPDAQSKLIEVLSTVMNLCKGSVDLVLTTHSPYVLSKFNNLIEAGALGRIEKLRDKVGSIVVQESWIRRKQLAAYAICDGKLLSITDGDGLINGEYLDGVSNAISTEFSQLLGVQFGDQASS